MKSIFVLFLTLGLVFANQPDLKEFASDTRKFSSAVYNELLLDNNENILVSPFSVETILALTESGAKDETATEMRTSLFLPETEEETQSLMKTVLPTFKSKMYILQTANKVYVENNYAIRDTFKSVASDIYQASFENVEFAESEKTAEEINKWVEEQTNHKIKDLVNSDDLDGEVEVLLVNALYFQGNWSQSFIPQNTKKQKFFTSTHDSVETDTMYIESLEANYFESEELDAQILELPLQGEQASMTFILPNKKEGISLLEKQIDVILFTPEFTKEKVEIALPKFRIESTIDFNSILLKLGMKKAFDASVADFSGIGGEPGDLYIEKVVQKTFIDVNEIGVEAAAATEIVIPENGIPTKTKSFIADHPFMFYLTVNDIVLFEGRVLVPEYKN